MLKNVDVSVEFVCISVFKNITSVCVYLWCADLDAVGFYGINVFIM